MPVQRPEPIEPGQTLVPHRVARLVFASGAAVSDPDGVYLDYYRICGIAAPAGWVGSLKLEARARPNDAWVPVRDYIGEVSLPLTAGSLLLLPALDYLALYWVRGVASQAQTAEREVLLILTEV